MSQALNYILLCYAALENVTGTHNRKDGFIVGAFHLVEFAQNNKKNRRACPSIFCLRLRTLIPS